MKREKSHALSARKTGSGSGSGGRENMGLTPLRNNWGTIISLIAAIVIVANTDSLSQTVAETQLLQLANQRFTNGLSLAEIKLFRSAANDEDAVFTNGIPEEDDPTNSGNWSTNRTIRADRLAWLCTNPQAAGLVTFQGVSIIGAKIYGNLELESATISFPLAFRGCVFTDNIHLGTANIRSLYLINTYVKILNGTGVNCEGNVYLSNGFRSDGGVSFGLASISGVLLCDGGQFINSNSVAIIVDGAYIGHGFYLRKAKVEGSLRLKSATVSGNFECDGGQFININGLAIDAENAKFEGNVFLRNGFRGEGDIFLFKAQVDGELDCRGGSFVNNGGEALCAANMNVRESISLCDGFSADGSVSLYDAKIGMDLFCRNGQFKNIGGFAVNAGQTEIGGSVIFSGGCEFDGLVGFGDANIVHQFAWAEIKNPNRAILDLQFAKVGTLLDEPACWPATGKLFLDGFTYDNFNRQSVTDAASRIKWLNLQPTNQFLPQPYEQLAGVLRKMGYDQDAAKVMIAKNENYARRLSWHSIFRLWYNFIGWLAGYGYLPGRAFKISVLVIAIGTVLTYRGHRKGHIKSTNLHLKSKSKVYSLEVALAYSVESFVPLLKFGVSEDWKPANHFLRRYFLIHRLAGWILTTLWIGAFTGLVKT